MTKLWVSDQIPESFDEESLEALDWKEVGGQAVSITDLGNNEQLSTGVADNGDGTYTAMTYTASKTFKTRQGAEKWLARRVSH